MLRFHWNEKSTCHYFFNYDKNYTENKSNSNSYNVSSSHVCKLEKVRRIFDNWYSFNRDISCYNQNYQ